ncbi:Jumonji domain containing 7 [Seminavis robusta]|uniref:Jumonji domain containing 7 n=1 Tax=Seminavis robusta TaxID=568900 RepID=A0A9N8DNV0_9STRA|nr:Jumonji domain containing 7 [Seminavis robusta]|eukprot:Sro266_g103110.1 Jumonji domain containing 7 (457) ;mRNA; f:30716-32086
MAITSTKRCSEEDDLEKEDGRKRLKAGTKICNEYDGYSLQGQASPKIDTVQMSSMSATTFFDQYIRQRKPCILDGLPPTTTTSSSSSSNDKEIAITRELLESVAGSRPIQVEKRVGPNDNFGQNRTATRQVAMPIRDFLKALLDSDNELLYWSTQEDTDDPYNVPCRQLLEQHKIPPQINLAGNLVLSSCNLWMGRSGQGASSGLHHDYHDNFYCLLHGRKRFRLLSPDGAPHLHVYGQIECIHPNGRISYAGNETRADGVPLSSLEEKDDDDDDDEEEEVVLGQGFDYISDDEEDQEAFEKSNQKDDFEEMFAQDDEKNVDDDDDNDNDTSLKNSSSKNDNSQPEDDSHPDSFSRINPCQADQDALHKEFPSYGSRRQVLIELQAGQMLYLPAGWFHEVTSYSSNKNNAALGECHMALNYWYHPPDDLENFDNPYKDDFWKKEEQHRLKLSAKKM